MNTADLFYLDTSALLPYYREEPASMKIQELLISLRPPVIISDLTKVEFAAALARWVRMNEISDAQAIVIENTFAKDVGFGLFLQKPIIKRHYSQAEKWLTGRKTALRTLDSLHLACCWDLGAELITCDKVLYQSSETLGIKNQFIQPVI
ncbi:MAG: type II toxin-antitoxin system VapC family toxin [Desulfosalsimonadaceae bacterium]